MHGSTSGELPLLVEKAQGSFPRASEIGIETKGPVEGNQSKEARDGFECVSVRGL